MKTQVHFLYRILISMVIGLVLTGTPANVQAVCDYEPDAPDCACFDDTGAWDPGGPYITDVAHATFGTVESCRCPGTDPDGIPGTADDCDWDPDPTDPQNNFTGSGKPYYQFVLGNHEPFMALSAAVMLSWGGIADPNWERTWWCSQTVSYWHLHASIPYPGGYRNDRHQDWNVRSSRRIVQWYLTEEQLRKDTNGQEGRGRFIKFDEVDFDAFELGVTVPVPGAYVSIKGFRYNPRHWLEFGTTGHSLMVDEMWVHRDSLGKIFRVELTLLQGNSGSPPQVRGGRWDDFESFLPRGSGWIPGQRKIYGFGIDLDEDGNPIYDPARVHYVNYPFSVTIPPLGLQVYEDPDEDENQLAVAKAVAYSRFLTDAGGPGVFSSSKMVTANNVPDGVETQWYFPKGIQEEVKIGIDLRTVHPTPVKGIELRWMGPQPPTGFTVQFAAADQQYKDAVVPDLSSVLSLLSQQASSIAVPVSLTSLEAGVDVRYLKLTFPVGTFSEQGATLQELRFRYDDGGEEDAESNPVGVDYTLDCTRAYPTQPCLWPSNHKLAKVGIEGIENFNGEPVSPSIFAISSDEPPASDKGAGGKRHAPDAFGLGTDTALLRAERSGDGDGRVYVVHFFADDGGERCKGSVEVKVPHDKRSKNCWAVDSGQDYDATGTN